MYNNNKEGFWGSNAWTPVRNRLYPTYPFGWHGQQQKPDFPTCFANPYINDDYLKSIISPLDNVKPKLDHPDIYSDFPQHDREGFINIGSLTKEQKREFFRSLLIISLICFVLLSIFHIYG